MVRERSAAEAGVSRAMNKSAFLIDLPFLEADSNADRDSSQVWNGCIRLLEYLWGEDQQCPADTWIKNTSERSTE